MLLRVGVAGANKTQCNALSNRLIAFSLCHTEEDVELDIAFYQDLEGLSRGYPQLDMAFVSGSCWGLRVWSSWRRCTRPDPPA